MSSTISLTETNREFVHQVEQESGQRVSVCNQCGKCTAGCPANFVMDFTPNQIMRLLQLDQKEQVLRCHAIWLCLSCIICTARCPRGIDIAAIFDVLRITARRNFIFPERNVKLFHDVFLNSVRTYGRIHEVGLLLRFNIGSRKFFNDLELGPKFLGRGKLHLLPRKIKGARQVANIYSKLGAE